MNRYKVLITGGLGYIGSHVTVEVINEGFEAIIVDNLSNSTIDVLKNIKKIVNNDNIKFYNVDLTVETKINEIFHLEKPDAVIHLAGYKSVNESIKNPLKYYHNNLISTMNILNAMEYFNCKILIFSSSATVYGNQIAPYNEETVTGIGITNPYGQTKYMIEVILKDLCTSNNVNKFTVIALRYFNPIGAHDSGLLKDDPIGIPNNIMPYIIRTANKTYDKLTIFGNDYDTNDGTAERDYIHVVDIAKGHVKALNNLVPGFHVYNLGTGIPISVKTLVTEFEKVNNVKVPYEYGLRREGDLPICYAKPNKAEKELNWKAEKTLADMVRINQFNNI